MTDRIIPQEHPAALIRRERMERMGRHTAEVRGHVLGGFHAHYARPTRFAVCRRCERVLEVSDTNISGGATAVDCDGIRQNHGISA